MEAKVFTNQTLIGTVHLEIGDYNMGGLYGVFTPNKYYMDKIQSHVQDFNEQLDWDTKAWNSFGFEVVLQNGEVLQPSGGIAIYDFDDMLGEPIQIELAGVDCTIIDRYFKS